MSSCRATNANPLDRVDIDGNPVTLDTLCRRAPDWAANRIRVMEAALYRIADWTHRYGARLKPSLGHADTFGDGVRACKEEVGGLLREFTNAVR